MIREARTAYLFLLPCLIFFVGFVVIPMFICIFYSLTNANMNAKAATEFIGLLNFQKLLTDKTFLEALRNTFVIVIVSVPAVCAFSLWVSSAIYKLSGPVLSAFRCIFYLPVVTGSVAVTVVWKWMYDNYTGILNFVLKGSGLIEKNINWLGDSKYALWCIILILFTTSVGQPIVLYVSALGNVDATQIEAAKVDGASTWRTYWKIIFPIMRPMHATVAVLTALSVWNDVMTPLVIMAGSGQNTLPLAQLNFQSQFGTNYNLAFASYLLSLIPILIFYLVCQKQIINGVVNGAVK